MSLRLRILLVFLVVNLVAVGGLVFYVRQEGSVSRQVLAKAERINQLQGERLRGALDSELGALLDRLTEEIEEVIGRRWTVAVGTQREQLDLALSIRAMPIWKAAGLRARVARAVLVHAPAGSLSPDYFNVHRDLVFEKETFRSRGPLEMVEVSRDDDATVTRGDRLARSLQVSGAHWGGFYLQLQEPERLGDWEDTSGRTLLLIFMLLVPGMLFLFGFTWFLLSRRVIGPIEELGRAARAAGRGDYSRRVEVPPTRDEIARVTVVFNRMLSLVQEYRDHMEAKVEEKTAEIERKNRELMLGQRLAATGTLASGIAHEINNPLGGMLNVARRLHRDDLTPEQKARYVEILEEGMERIGSIVRRVLAVSPRKMTPSPLSLTPILERSVELVRHRADTRRVSLELEAPASHAPVLGESNEVGQIFLNLLINGVDACRPGGHVTARLRQEGEWIFAEIADDGEGMEPEVAAQAFDIFFTTKDAGEGTGLGLATVRSLVESHGGTLELDTRPGEGTRVVVRFPIGSPPR